jgi:transcriptional regulator with XRE-family HTH domain
MSDRENSPRASENGFEIGPTLEQARKDRGLSLFEVEQATKIRKRYLQGLERDDYGALPDAIYARGFLKTYANYLGLDGEELAWQLKNRRAPRRERHAGGVPPPSSSFDEPLISPGGLSGTGNRRVSSATVMALLIGLVALGAVIGTLYYIGRGSGTAAEDPAPAEQRAENDAGGSAADSGGAANPPDEEAANERPSGSGDGATNDGASGDGGGDDAAPPVPDGLTAVIRVEGAPSWLQIQSDGEVALEQVAEPGFSQTFEAREQIIINTGNAGAVSVEVNGQDLGTLGENGEVLTREIDLKAST